MEVLRAWGVLIARSFQESKPHATGPAASCASSSGDDHAIRALRVRPALANHACSPTCSQLWA